MRGRQPTATGERPFDKSPQKERPSKTLVPEVPAKRKDLQKRKSAGRKEGEIVYRGAKKTARRRSAPPDSGAWPVSTP